MQQLFLETDLFINVLHVKIYRRIIMLKYVAAMAEIIGSTNNECIS